MLTRQRLDLLVLERGLFTSRQIAQTAIMTGCVLVDGKKLTKPGQTINATAKIELIPSYQVPRFVSRGGLKLEKALITFNIGVTGRICLDIGASTGGFTDCLLKNGASKVYAIDVGYGQFDWKLRCDPKVVLRERQNARHLTRQSLYELGAEIASLATIDVSFISLKTILPSIIPLLDPARAELVCLVKPQFEVGRTAVGKGGVIKSKETHRKVIEQVIETAHQLNLAAIALTYSPVVGPAGNLEFLIQLMANRPDKMLCVADIVQQAHDDLKTSKP